MATDYDAPRKSIDEETESLDAIKERMPSSNSSSIDVDVADGLSYDIAGDNMTDMELDVVVVPQQDDEFICTECFIVRHHSQLYKQDENDSVCAECAI